MRAVARAFLFLVRFSMSFGRLYLMDLLMLVFGRRARRRILQNSRGI